MHRQGPASVGPCLAIAVVCLLLLLTSCSADQDKSAGNDAAATTLPSTAWARAKPGAVKAGGTLKLAVATIPENFNPYAGAGDRAARAVFAPTQGSAVAIEANGDWRVNHDYATSIRASRGEKLVVEVALNAAAVWSDGQPIVAKDMIAWWRAMNASDEKFDVASSAGFDDIASVTQGKTRLDYTVTFARRITDWPRYIYPGLPASVTATAKKFNTGQIDQPPPSNGPFVIKTVDRAAGVITQVPNPHWWGNPPKLHTIKYLVIDPTRQAQAFADKKIDALDIGQDVPTYDIVKARADARIQRAAGPDWTQLTFNSTRGPLREVRVRRAIAHAIDRKKMSAQVSKPLGAPAVTQGSMIYVPGQQGYRDAATAAIGFEPAESLALLTAAGYARDADGLQTKAGKVLALTITVPANMPANEARARSIQGDLRKVGIPITLKTVPAATFFDEQVIPLDFDLVTFSWHNAILPVTAAQPLFNPVDSGQNYTGGTSPKLAGLWEKANAEPDANKQLVLAHDIDVELFSYVPLVPIAPTPVVFAVATRLANYGAAQFEHPDFTRVGFTK